MSKKNIIILTLLALVTILFLKIKTSTPQNTAPVPIMPSPTPVPNQSFLSFSPEILYMKLGQDNEVSIQINSQGKYPTLIQLEIAYDPEVITQVELTPDTFFPNPEILLNNNDQQTGRLSYALSLPKDSSGVAAWTPPRWPQRVGIVAKLKFTVSKTTAQSDTQLYFLPKTEILSQSTNIPIKISNGLKIYTTSPTIPASTSSFLR